MNPQTIRIIVPRGFIGKTMKPQSTRLSSFNFKQFQFGKKMDSKFGA